VAVVNGVVGFRRPDPELERLLWSEVTLVGSPTVTLPVAPPTVVADAGTVKERRRPAAKTRGRAALPIRLFRSTCMTDLVRHEEIGEAAPIGVGHPHWEGT
jgi:hypothetical protein